MRCPKCQSEMQSVDHQGTEVDRCTSCGGLWFDDGELEKLRSREAAAAIDIGDPDEGRAQNRKDRYRCPRCNATMLKMVDPLQRHIWYERCSSCKGMFFDAGEFRDLASFTLSDILKILTAPSRH